MKKYTDQSENFIYKKYETLNDLLKYHFEKAHIFEKSLKEMKEN